MDWSNDLILEFLDLYAQEPIVWDQSHPDFKNRHRAYDAWKRIQEQLSEEIPISELKRKKESLMASFRTCYNKVRQTPDYKPVWFAYSKIASFLKKGDADTTSNTRNNESPSSDKIRRSTKQEIDSDSDNALVDDNEYSSEPDTKKTKSEANVSATSNSSNLKSLRRPLLKRKKRFGTHPIKHEMATTVTQPRSITQGSPKIAKTKDECDLYGELVAKKLRKMDERTRDIAMNRIDNLLFQMKMNYFNYEHSPNESQKQASSSTYQSAANQSPPTSPHSQDVDPIDTESAEFQIKCYEESAAE